MQIFIHIKALSFGSESLILSLAFVTLSFNFFLTLGEVLIFQVRVYYYSEG